MTMYVLKCIRVEFFSSGSLFKFFRTNFMEIDEWKRFAYNFTVSNWKIFFSPLGNQEPKQGYHLTKFAIIMVRFHLKICWETRIEYHEVPSVKAKEALATITQVHQRPELQRVCLNPCEGYNYLWGNLFANICQLFQGATFCSSF